MHSFAIERIFSVFNTHPLNLDETENWEDYPIVFLTPNGDSWDPHSTHYSEEEATMVDHYGVHVDHTACKCNALFDCVNVSQFYAQEISWDKFDEIVSHLAYDDPDMGTALMRMRLLG